MPLYAFLCQISCHQNGPWQGTNSFQINWNQWLQVGQLNVSLLVRGSVQIGAVRTNFTPETGPIAVNGTCNTSARNIILTRFSHISYWQPFLIGHETQHREYDKTRQETSATVHTCVHYAVPVNDSIRVCYFEVLVQHRGIMNSLMGWSFWHVKGTSLSIGEVKDFCFIFSPDQ